MFISKTGLLLKPFGSQVPAIQAEDLTAALLRLLDLGVALKDITHGLPWLDPPPLKSTEYAAEVLRRLQAIQWSPDKDEEKLTPHGHAMARLPLHPRLAHMVLRAEDSKENGTDLGSVATLCALLEEERDVLQDSQRGLCADVATRLRALRGEDLPQRYRNMTVLPKHCSRVQCERWATCHAKCKTPSGGSENENEICDASRATSGFGVS